MVMVMVMLMLMLSPCLGTNSHPTGMVFQPALYVHYYTDYLHDDRCLAWGLSVGTLLNVVASNGGVATVCSLRPRTLPHREAQCGDLLSCAVEDPCALAGAFDHDDY